MIKPKKKLKTMNKTLAIIFSILLSFSCIHPVCSQSYNYYFGNIHSHSSYSDGNQDSGTSMMTTPYQDFMYARQSQHIDFYGICDHNHSQAGMVSPSYYHNGLHQADSATLNGTFIALYGMEWGVISGGGHVLIYGSDSLIGWEPNNYDVFVAKNNYPDLWKKVNRMGAIAYLAHPNSGDYSNLFSSYLSAGDSAVVGMAARSGPAFSTNVTYSNPSTSNYISEYNNALKQGYHLGVGLDHDTHNSVFGRQSAGRLVVLASSLTRPDILDALKNMRFYSSDDWNVKVNFTISSQPIGSILSQAGMPSLSVNISDPDGENTSSITVYQGVPGSGVNPTVLTSVTNNNNLSYVHNLSNNTSSYYYVKIVQNDGNTIWTSPIWYKRDDSITSIIDRDRNTIPVNVFPNPVNTSEPLMIELLDQVKQTVTIELINSLGETVFKDFVKPGNGSAAEKIVINTNDFAEGIYVLRIANTTHVTTRKIVLN